MSDLLSALPSMTLAQLQACWQARIIEQWRHHPDYYLAAGQRALKLGEPLVAFDCFNEGVELLPEHLILRRHLAFAAARSGASLQAMELLTTLVAKGDSDIETLGMLARCHKDIWLSTPDSELGRTNLRQALTLYRAVFQNTGSYWTGINAATLSLASGDAIAAEALAVAVQLRTEMLLTNAQGVERYWILATLGEAAVITGDIELAHQWLREAVAVADAGISEFASTRRNLRVLERVLGLPESTFTECFPKTTVVVFSGHMLDAPDRQPPRFPAGNEAMVAEAIARQLAAIDARFGCASAANGSDLLFLEAMLQRGGDIHIVLPHPPEQFIRTSVDRGNPQWVDRFEAVLQRASRVTITSNADLGQVGYRYANRVLLGLARARAAQVGGQLHGVAVWDEQAGQPGGTAECVQDWKRCGLPYSLIRPATEVPSSAGPSDDVVERPYEMVALMFADAVGFSKLDEDQIPIFIEHFLGRVAAVVQQRDYAVRVRNTWGDGIYFVIGNVRDAGLLALDLADLMRHTRWANLGLPKDMNARFALHCGPAFPYVDPITERHGYSGVHVSRAARIEPVTPPGEVYCSESFAALCAAEDVTEFRTDYVGQLPLAKKYGVFPAYRVMRADAFAKVGEG